MVDWGVGRVRGNGVGGCCQCVISYVVYHMLCAPLYQWCRRQQTVSVCVFCSICTHECISSLSCTSLPLYLSAFLSLPTSAAKMALYSALYSALFPVYTVSHVLQVWDNCLTRALTRLGRLFASERADVEHTERGRALVQAEQDAVLRCVCTAEHCVCTALYTCLHNAPRVYAI